MMRNVNTNKGLAYDGVSDSIFQIGKCKTNEDIDKCQVCQNKIKFAKSLLRKEYWDS